MNEQTIKSFSNQKLLQELYAIDAFLEEGGSFCKHDLLWQRRLEVEVEKRGLTPISYKREQWGKDNL